MISTNEIRSKIDTLIACINSAHRAKSGGWKQSCWDSSNMVLAEIDGLLDDMQQNLDLGTKYRIELDKLSQRNCELRTENAALKEQSVTEQVAWRTFDGDGGYDYRAYDENENYHEEWIKRNPHHIGWVDRLYTTPQTKSP